MNIVEKEALAFSKSFYSTRRPNNLESLKSLLSNKIYSFNRERDKLDFLKILRQESLKQKEDHLKTCTGKGCSFPEERDLGIFVIDQEIDSINRYYKYAPKSDDEFTSEEEANLHSKLNEIIEKLKDLGYGQEILFDEIESLKDHFDLGKKNWFQLLKGKLFELTLDQILEKTIVAEIFNFLAEGFTRLISA